MSMRVEEITSVDYSVKELIDILMKTVNDIHVDSIVIRDAIAGDPGPNYEDPQIFEIDPPDKSVINDLKAIILRLECIGCVFDDIRNHLGA